MRFFNDFLIRKNINKFHATPVSALEQLVVTNGELSDHKPYIVKLCSTTSVVVWNVMMRGKQRNDGFNNGFRRVENKAQYQERLSLIGEQFCNWVEADKSIIAGLIAEGPIKTEDSQLLKTEIKKRKISGWEDFCLMNTDFGVTKIFKNGFANQALYEDKDLTELLEPALRSRVLSYKGNELYSLTNVHVPFQNSKEAYKKILRPIVKKMIGDILPDQYRCHDICGDKNIPSLCELEAIQAVFEEMTNQLQQEKNSQFSPVSMTIELKTSDDGHLKDVNGTQQSYQVDSALRITVCKSHTNQNEFFDLSIKKHVVIDVNSKPFGIS